VCSNFLNIFGLSVWCSGCHYWRK